MDISEFISLNQAGYEKYLTFVAQTAERIVDLGLEVEDIPDEEAVEQPDGSLLIYVDLPRRKGRIEFAVPKGEWFWRNQN